MAILADAIGEGGLMNDGDWILSENMDSNGSIGVIQLKHVGVGEFIDKDFNFVTEETFFKLGCTEVLPGDILISRMADPIARACVVPRLPFRCVTAVDVTILRVGCDSDPRYICYLCNSDIIRQQAERAVRGTTRARITRTELQNFLIPLPPLLEQKHIANILGKADRLRRVRRYALELSGTYLQSIFLEMFGDPVANPKGWPQDCLSNLCEPGNGIKAGPFGSSLKKESYSDKGARVYGQEQVIGGDFAIGNYYITYAMFDDFKAYQVKPGDVLISLVGSYGKVAVVPEGIEPGIINPRLLKISPKPQKIKSIFLTHCFENPATQMNLLHISHGGTMGILNAGLLRELKMIVPPIYIQEQFVRIVQKFERLQSQQREAERQAGHLFQTLLHRAFRGQLTAE
jgi:type I restriction enzyme S subunit